MVLFLNTEKCRISIRRPLSSAFFRGAASLCKMRMNSQHGMLLY
jgi:hypothetical protein